MVIAILADEILREEWLSKNVPSQVEMVWADSMRSLAIIEADVYIDLLFEYDPERIARLAKLLPKTVLVNSVVHTLKDIGEPFIRINGWPTMLRRAITEIVTTGEEQEEQAKALFGNLGWDYQPVPDTTGMVTPRILAVIINEAWYTLGDDTSTKEEIDIAMKLGTNYPLGPFEWGEKIGIQKISALLHELHRSDSRYTIAPLLAEQ